MCKPEYEYPNAFFRTSDPHPQEFAGFEIPEGWWSRPYEYYYGMTFCEVGDIAADMGCGWNYRPFHDALTNKCRFVYGVDSHAGILELPEMINGAFVVADFSKPITDIQPKSLDKIYCISVLEETNYTATLIEFSKLLKDGGRIVITCDVPYNESRPAHDKYKGILLHDLDVAIRAAGLEYDGKIDRVKYDDTVYQENLNLCVWHCVLRKHHG